MRSDADFSVYVAQVGDVKFFIIVYVDDLILVCNNKDKLLQVKEELSRKFEMKRSWRLAFLPWHGSGKGSCTTTSLHQPNWISQGDSQRFHMEDCKAIGVPLDPKTKLKKNVNRDDEMVKVPYQQAVGSLMYAMLCTRLDLAYLISVLSQHIANPSLEHWIAVKRIF